MEPGRVQRARAFNPALASVSQDAPVQASPCLSPAWLREGGSPGGGGPVQGGAELEKPAGLERCGHRLHSSTWRLLRDTHPHALPPRGWEQKSSPQPGLGGGEEGWALSPGVGRQGDEETEGQRQRERERQGPREGKRKRDTHGAGFRLREAETRAGNRSGSPVGSPFKIHQNPARVPSTSNQGVRAPSAASRLHLPPLGPLPTRGRGARCFQIGPVVCLVHDDPRRSAWAWHTTRSPLRTGPHLPRFHCCPWCPAWGLAPCAGARRRRPSEPAERIGWTGPRCVSPGRGGGLSRGRVGQLESARNSFRWRQQQGRWP
ncbi:uncharacterized protein [Equus przewalskii]|uniref:Uncharacterized protein isoform X2 n=1 Tax=Equus przewalskii TaxID=9798 RepID=A0ABM4LYM0_EQUPR